MSLAPDGIGGEHSDTWTMSIIMKKNYEDNDGVPRSIAENRGVYKAHFAAIVRSSKIRN